MRQKKVVSTEPVGKSKKAKTLMAEFILGKFYGIADILKQISVEDYIQLASVTVDNRAELMQIIKDGSVEDIEVSKENFLKKYNEAVEYMFDNPDDENDIYGKDVTIHWNGFYCNCGDGAVPYNGISEVIKECIDDE
jgi:adenine C2-methylase RlmN of 23S rRNA A2503 and tRNA A37